MKKRIAFLALPLVALLAACTHSNTTTKGPIDGAWQSTLGERIVIKGNQATSVEKDPTTGKTSTTLPGVVDFDKHEIKWSMREYYVITLKFKQKYTIKGNQMTLSNKELGRDAVYVKQ